MQYMCSERLFCWIIILLCWLPSRANHWNLYYFRDFDFIHFGTMKIKPFRNFIPSWCHIRDRSRRNCRWCADSVDLRLTAWGGRLDLNFGPNLKDTWLWLPYAYKRVSSVSAVAVSRRSSISCVRKDLLAPLLTCLFYLPPIFHSFPSSSWITPQAIDI